MCLFGGRRDSLFVNPFKQLTKAPCKFHLLQGACSSPVVCRAPLLECPVVYRITGCGACVPDAMQHGRSVLQPLASLSRTSAAAMMHCRSGTLPSSGVSIGAWLKPALPKQNADSAKVPDQRSTTTRRYRPSGLQERVRRVVLHRIRDTRTILADQWRHECDANISIIARDLSSARFIGARSASPASSPIAGLARRLPASTAQAQPRARLDLPRGRRIPIPGDDIGPHGIGPQTSREAWSTQTSASSDLSINVRRVGKGARRTFYTISASLTARAVPTRQW